MAEMICFVLALIILGVSGAAAYKRRYNTTKCIAAITTGVFFSTFFMVLPTQWVGAGKEVFCEPLYAAVSSLFYSLKALGGRQSLDQLETMALPGALKAVYIVVNYICFALVPVLASSLILSFVGDTGERIRFLLRFSPKCYVFSEVNENALALVEGLRKKPGKKTVVFCGAKGIDKALAEKAKQSGAIVLYKSCDSLKLSRRFSSFEFFLISADEDSNILLAETVVAKHAHNQKRELMITAFVESGTNVNFLESVVKSKGGHTNIQLRCIDEIALLCSHLIYENPLYNTRGSGNQISAAVVGCGRMGMRMLKTAYWAGQIDGYSLKIRVYDKKAEKCREEFYRQCPGLKGEETIQFIETDVNSAAFEEQLLAEENSGDATYIVVAMDSDQLNLSVADRLYRLYRRHFEFRDQRMPEILARVRSQAKSRPYFSNSDFLETRRIRLFGTTAGIFSSETLFHTELENLAFAVHLTYQGKLHLDRNCEEYEEIRREFKTSEYSRRSSMASALHMPAKLCMCSEIPKTGKNMLTPENLEIYAACVAANEELRQRLAANEHDRWSAFLLTEGYQSATVEQMHQYAAAVGSHKDDLSMLHPCITGWDALEELEHTYNTAYGKNKKFKKYDQEIVEKVPEIWMAAQNMKNGGHEHVSTQTCRYIGCDVI